MRIANGQNWEKFAAAVVAIAMAFGIAALATPALAVPGQNPGQPIKLDECNKPCKEFLRLGPGGITCAFVGCSQPDGECRYRC